MFNLIPHILFRYKTLIPCSAFLATEMTDQDEKPIDLDGGCMPTILPFPVFLYVHQGPSTRGGFKLATFDKFINQEYEITSLFVEFVEPETQYRPTSVTFDSTFSEYNCAQFSN